MKTMHDSSLPPSLARLKRVSISLAIVSMIFLSTLTVMAPAIVWATSVKTGFDCWTDKGRYEIGQVVTIYVKIPTVYYLGSYWLLINKPDGSKPRIDLGELLPARTYSFTSQADSPSGQRKVEFWTNPSSPDFLAYCYFDVGGEVEVKFRGEVTDQSPPIIGAKWWQIRVKEIISDKQGVLKVDLIARVGYVVAPPLPSRVDTVKIGDYVEVYGRYQGGLDISLNGERYYIVKSDVGPLDAKFEGVILSTYGHDYVTKIKRILYDPSGRLKTEDTIIVPVYGQGQVIGNVKVGSYVEVCMELGAGVYKSYHYIKRIDESGFVVHLSSVTTDGRDNVGTITFDGVEYTLPGQVTVSPSKWYPVGANPPSGYEFDHWEMGGGVRRIKDPYAKSTEVYVEDAGSLKAWFKIRTYTLTINPNKFSVQKGESLYFTGRVTDNDGKGVPNIQVGVDDPVEEICKLGPKTDSDGKFVYPEAPLKPTKEGSYLFTFYVEGASAKGVIIDVGSGRTWGTYSRVTILNKLDTVYRAEFYVNDKYFGSSTIAPSEEKTIARTEKYKPDLITNSLSTGVSYHGFGGFIDEKGRITLEGTVPGILYGLDLVFAFYRDSKDYGACVGIGTPVVTEMLLRGTAQICFGTDGVSAKGSGSYSPNPALPPVKLKDTVTLKLIPGVLIARASARIQPGASNSTKVDVAGGVKQLMIRVAWQGSELDLHAIAPNGMRYEAEALGQHEKRITVDNPMGGAWQIVVYGKSVPAEGEVFFLEAYSSSAGPQLPVQLILLVCCLAATALTVIILVLRAKRQTSRIRLY